MKTAIIAIAIATLYILSGVIIAWVIARNAEPKSPHEAEALAALLVFSTLCWPLVLIVLAVFCVSQNFKNDEEEK